MRFQTVYIDNDDFIDQGADGEPIPSGWYWRARPDGDPIGPFKTEEEAFANAQRHNSCDHDDTYINDRSQTVCRECGEELGR